MSDKTYGRLSLGASMVGEEEANLAAELIRDCAINRDWSPNRRHVCLQFEQEFAQYIGTNYGLAVTSGTAALKVALQVAGVGPGHEVICPAVTFIASPGSVVQVGAVPTFCEVDESMTMDVDDIENHITPHTKAIMPVHLWGGPARIDRIMEIAKKHNLMVVEDCAQSCGVKYKGKRIGSFGHINAFSMQFAKAITGGEGGAIVTDDPEMYERATRLHDQGVFQNKKRWPDFDGQLEEFVGDNFRISEVTGALMLSLLRKLDFAIETLRPWSKRFLEVAESIPRCKPRPDKDMDSWFGLRWGLIFDDVQTCEAFEEALKRNGLKPNVPYGRLPVYARPMIMNKKTVSEVQNPWTSPLYKGNAEYYEGLCPRSEDILKRALTVGAPNPQYKEQDIEFILGAIQKAADEIK